ncbi:hypothetical protein [Stenotrophomonas rhizophila]|jgi:hypothetical protein|uniref:hypothetical protein n=1 Tax=Stenotrophomonas rhizophila TaxID=216778 RepID=UPI0011A23615|nr:hypothetical protein [Stenotrophomonas rhizophila]
MTDAFHAFKFHSREDFQIWLASDVEVRDELYAMMPDDPGRDMASLDAVEAFLLGRFANPDAALSLEHRAVLDAVARHIGLVMVLALGEASWDIDLDDPDNVYYRLPIVRMEDGSEECPLSMATAALDRRQPGYLRGVAESYE